MRYDKGAAALKEEAGRAKYLAWIGSKPECTHQEFAVDHWSSWDAIFYSAGTMCYAEIKNRLEPLYTINFLTRFGAEVDLKKASEVYHLATSQNALPLVLTFSNDNWLIVSDLNKARCKDVSLKIRRQSNNEHFTTHKQMLNLSGCTI
jgi:hypothetical protein